MFSPYNSDADFLKAESFFKENMISSEAYALKMAVPEKIMSVREAVFSDYEMIDTKDAAGRICASPTVGCPPAVPVVVSGELISEDAVVVFERYSITKCIVIK